MTDELTALRARVEELEGVGRDLHHMLHARPDVWRLFGFAERGLVQRLCDALNAQPTHDPRDARIADLDAFAPSSDMELDGGIRYAVLVLRRGGIDTYESCEGGEGHAFLEPTVRFNGTRAEGWRALTVALENGLPVYALRRVWSCSEGEPNGPFWEMTFSRKPINGPAS